MLRLYRKKERRRVTRPINSITGSSIVDGSVTNTDIANESIQLYHLAPNLASLLDTVRSGLTTLLGATPLSTTPRDPTFSTTPTSRTVSWSHPSNSQGGTPVDFTTQLTLTSGQTIYYIDSYELRYRIHGEPTWINVLDISSSTTYTFNISDPYQAYQVQIRGRNDAVGNSDWVDVFIPVDTDSRWSGNVTVALLSLSSNTATEINYTVFQGATSNSSVIATNTINNNVRDNVVFSTPHEILYDQRTSTFLIRINSHGGGVLGIAGSSTQAASANATITFADGDFIVTPTTLGIDVTIGIVITGP